MALRRCAFEEALVVGISNYPDQPLPKAATDAQDMERLFRELGCRNVVLSATQADPLPKEEEKNKLLNLISVFFERIKFHIETEETDEPLLAVLYVASHGIQGKKQVGIHGENPSLPLIVPAGHACSSDTKDLVDLNVELVQKLEGIRLPRQTKRTCCIWIIMDMCRSWPQNNSDQPAGGSGDSGDSGPVGSKPILRFLYTLPCREGQPTSDTYSLASALIESFRESKLISIQEAHDMSCEKIDTEGRPRRQMSSTIQFGSGVIFSNIKRLPYEEALVALGVLICFLGLFWVPRFAEGKSVSQCPQPNGAYSCLCTDCHHSFLYPSHNSSVDYQDYQCNLGPLSMNRCGIAKVILIIKLLATLWVSLKSWKRVWKRTFKASFLDWCVAAVSVGNFVTSAHRLLSSPALAIVISPCVYGFINLTFIVASLYIVINVLKPNYKGTTPNFGAFSFPWFLMMALISQVVLFVVLCCLGAIDERRARKQRRLFYDLYVLIVAIVDGVGYLRFTGTKQESSTDSDKPDSSMKSDKPKNPMKSDKPKSPMKSDKPKNPMKSDKTESPMKSDKTESPMKSDKTESPMKAAARSLFCISLFWTLLVLTWLRASLQDEEMMAQFRLIRVILERVCTLWKVHLMVRFADLTDRPTDSNTNSTSTRFDFRRFLKDLKATRACAWSKMYPRTTRARGNRVAPASKSQIVPNKNSGAESV